MVALFVRKFCDVKCHKITYSSTRDLVPRQYMAQMDHFEI